MRCLEIKNLVTKRAGVATLAITIFITLFLFAIMVFLSGESDTSVISGQLNSQTDRAQFLAETGIQDAILKLARDKNVSGTYMLSETDGTIDISISSSTPIVVNATASVSGAGVTILWSKEAQITIDADGKITSISSVNK